MNHQFFSIVVPVYGCAECLEQLCENIRKNILLLTGQYEIILVDDRSLDNGWDVICKLKKQYREIKGVRLSRNFGQHIAISVGLSKSIGDYVIVMDCDLQDPPEVIADLYTKLQTGYDFVLGYRNDRKHSYFRVIASQCYFKLMQFLTANKIDGHYGTLSILSRKVVDAYLKFNEKDRHYIFILNWIGFHMGKLEYVQNKRCKGTSSYSLQRLLTHAIEGLFFQTTIFLKWIVGIGLFVALCGIISAIYFIYCYFLRGSLAGWTSLVVLLLICTGVILVGLGTIGLYIGKIFEQTKNRPLFIIDTMI